MKSKDIVRGGQEESSEIPDSRQRELKKRLTNAMADLRLTQGELAKRWGYSEDYIYLLVRDDDRGKPIHLKLEDRLRDLEREAAEAVRKREAVRESRTGDGDGREHELKEEGDYQAKVDVRAIVRQEVAAVLKRIAGELEKPER